MPVGVNLPQIVLAAQQARRNQMQEGLLRQKQRAQGYQSMLQQMLPEARSLATQQGDFSRLDRIAPGEAQDIRTAQAKRGKIRANTALTETKLGLEQAELLRQSAVQDARRAKQLGLKLTENPNQARLMVDQLIQAGAEPERLEGVIDDPRAARKLGQALIDQGNEAIEIAEGPQVTEAIAKAAGLNGVPLLEIEEAMQDPRQREAILSTAKQLILPQGETPRNVETKLRKEFQGLKPVQNTQDVAQAFEKIQGAPSTGAGDMSLVFSFMKMLDPGSTVREGEFANAKNAGSIPERVRGIYNSLVSGDFLDEGQRRDFKDRAKDVFAAQMRRFAPIAQEYSRLAKNAGVDPRNVVLNTQLEELLKKRPGDQGNADPAGQETEQRLDSVFGEQ